MGKSPLRLVSERKQIFKGCWRETLACGHTVDTFQEFLWDANAHLVMLEPTAERRRCRACKAIDEAALEAVLNEALPPKKPPQSITAPAVERKRKGEFGR